MQRHFLTGSVVATGLLLAGILARQSAGQPAKTEPPGAAARLAAAERV